MNPISVVTAAGVTCPKCDQWAESCGTTNVVQYRCMPPSEVRISDAPKFRCVNGCRVNSDPDYDFFFVLVNEHKIPIEPYYPQ